MVHCNFKALVVCLLLALASSAEKDPNANDYLVTSASPIIQEELGLALLPSRLLAQSTESVFQSVFLKLTTPNQPDNVCNLTCSPNITEINEMLTPRDGCWIPKMVIVRSSIVDETTEKSVANCFLKCLMKGLCRQLSYDPKDGTCTLQTGDFYRTNDLDQALNSASARMECILENHGATKASLCKNENLLFDSVLHATLEEHNHLMDHLIQRFQDVKSAYDLTGSKIMGANRNKRSWDTFDFLGDIPIIGHFYNILKSPTENRKLKEHVLKLQNRFQQFAVLVEEDITTTRRFLDEILEKVDAGFSHIYKEIDGLKCDVASLSSLMIFQQAIKTHELKLEQLFYASRHGKLKTSIPQTLSLEDLTTVVSNNPNFADTLYHTNPEVLYRVGELYLVDVHKGEHQLLFHFLLAAPKLKMGSIFQTYQPIAVPITTDDSELCFEVNLPNTILIRDNKFYSADTTDCYVKHDVTFCQQDFEDLFSPSITHLPCLAEDTVQCPLTPVPCHTKMVFTKAGALIFSQKDILVMKRGQSTRLTVASSTHKFSYFLEWQYYTMIQSDHRIMYSLDNSLTIRNLTWTAPSTSYTFREYLAKTSRHLIAANISLLQEKIENTTVLVHADLSPNFLGLNISRKSFLDFSGVFSLITTLVSISAILILCCYKRFKKQSHILQLVMAILKDEKRLKRRLEGDTTTVKDLIQPSRQIFSNPEDIEPKETPDPEITSIDVPIKTDCTPAIPLNDVTQAIVHTNQTVKVDAYGSD